MANYADLSGFKFKLDHARYSPTMIEALQSGLYECNERRIAPEVFERGDRIIEIGSSIGSVSVLLASIVGPENYIGYEANPELMPDLIENGHLNNISLLVHNAVLFNRKSGLAGKPVNFYIAKDFWISALEPSGHTIRTVQVQTLCLEDEIEKFRANAMLLDIEGGEVPLLEGADLSRIDKIVMELHYWPSHEGANRMMAYLYSIGFTVDFSKTFGHAVVLHRGYVPIQRNR